MTHVLKIRPHYFEPIIMGNKTFEVRSKEDREFQIGDIIVLVEIDAYDCPTGRNATALITYVLDDEHFCKNGFVILGFHLQGTRLQYDER